MDITPPASIARRRLGTQAHSSPAVMVGRGRPASWHSPINVSKNSPPQSEEAVRLRNRTMELVDINRHRNLSEQNSPRLASARQDSAYRANIDSLKLSEHESVVVKRGNSLGDLWEESTSTAEDILNRIRAVAQAIVLSCREQRDLESKKLSPLDLVRCGLRVSYPHDIRVLPQSQTILIRGDFIARGAQKKVWASTEISLKGTWTREVVEYEVVSDDPGRMIAGGHGCASPRGLQQFLSGLGPSECFPPQGHQIGVGSTDAHRLYMQSIRFEGTALGLDPDKELNRVLRVYGNAARALCYLHAHRILHRDVKGANIFVRGPCGYLGDLDDACWADDVRELVDSAVYAAPELATRGSFNTFASDQWAFGITLWQGFYGRLYRKDDSELLETVLPPFAQNLPVRGSMALCIQLDELSEAVIDNGLKFPNRRFGKAEAFLQEAISGLLVKNPKRRLLMSHVVMLLNKALKTSESNAED